MLILVSPRPYYHALVELVRLLRKHRELVFEFTKREITERYAGQVLGSLWAVGHPMLVMCVLVFIWGFVLKTKLSMRPDMAIPPDFTVFILSGLVPWYAFQETMTKSTTAINNNSDLVKQVVFPIEVLPVSVTLSTCISLLLQMLFLVVYVGLRHQVLPWTYALLPLLIVVQILGMIGTAYLFSAIGAYFKDLKDFVGVFCFLGFFVMPLFFTIDNLPQAKYFFLLNPFSHMIWCYRDVLYFGAIEHPASWVVFIGLSILMFVGGYRVFRKAKLFLGNVI